jgi:hypothetical protein
MNTRRFLTLCCPGTLTQLGLLAAARSVFAEPSLTIYSDRRWFI